MSFAGYIRYCFFVLCRSNNLKNTCESSVKSQSKITIVCRLTHRNNHSINSIIVVVMNIASPIPKLCKSVLYLNQASLMHVYTIAVTIHSCHNPIRFDSVRSRFDQSDSVQINAILF